MSRPIPTQVYHFTRVEHLASIVRNGLLSDTEVQQRSVLRQELGDHGIKSARRRRPVPCGAGGYVADYVPFYFAPRSPMLYSIAKGNVPNVDSNCNRVIYLITTTQNLQATRARVVYSNQNARMDFASMTVDDTLLDGDDFIDWPLMRSKFWNNTVDDPDRKERRQAEFLVHTRVAWSVITEVAAKTPGTASEVQAILAQARMMTKVSVHPDWYF